MPKAAHVHVIDFDFRRRAEISRDLLTRDFHPEIYESAAEFLDRLPDDGPVLMMENEGRDELADLLGKARNRGRFFPVAMYSEDPMPERVVRALHDGAIDYLRWPFDLRLFDLSLRRLAEEGERRRAVEEEKAAAQAVTRTLTARENEVLFSLVQGNSSKEIATELGLSTRTVEIYRKRVVSKLEARSSTDAVRIAIQAGILDARVV
jgi:FixJ family two-component response regulator